MLKKKQSISSSSFLSLKKTATAPQEILNLNPVVSNLISNQHASKCHMLRYSSSYGYCFFSFHCTVPKQIISCSFFSFCSESSSQNRRKIKCNMAGNSLRTACKNDCFSLFFFLVVFFSLKDDYSQIDGHLNLFHGKV